MNLLFATDDDVLTDAGVMKTLYDPACGTGGMLSVAEDHLRILNPSARLEVFGQETQRRDLRHLPFRHDAEGPGRQPHRGGELISRRASTNGPSDEGGRLVVQVGELGVPVGVRRALLFL